MSKHHLIISGTGRAGTTFLVQLLTALGFDTGYDDLTSGMYSHCAAGMEWNIEDPKAPYIIKSPRLCDSLDDLLQSGDLLIDHAIIPVRDLYSAAESRRDVTRRTDAALFPGEIPGGLWHTEIPQYQEAVLGNQLYKLIFTVAKRDIPVTLLNYPRLVHDPEYLYQKIQFMLTGIEYPSFLAAFERTARPELMHAYGQQESVAAGSRAVWNGPPMPSLIAFEETLAGSSSVTAQLGRIVRFLLARLGGWLTGKLASRREPKV